MAEVDILPMTDRSNILAIGGTDSRQRLPYRSGVTIRNSLQVDRWHSVRQTLSRPSGNSLAWHTAMPIHDATHASRGRQPGTLISIKCQGEHELTRQIPAKADADGRKIT